MVDAAHPVSEKAYFILCRVTGRLATPAWLLLVAVAAAVMAGTAGAIADVRAVDAPVFVIATSVAIVLSAALLIARAQLREHALRRMIVGLSAAVTAGGAGAAVEFASGRLAPVSMGIGTGAAILACGVTWVAWAAPRVTAKHVVEPFADEPPVQVDAETVTVGLENVRWVLADEQARGHSLQTRASGLAGFGGIIISLLAATIGTVGRQRDLDGAERTVVVAFLAYGLILLLVAIAMLLLGVLRTRRIEATAVSELELYAKKRFMTRSPQWAQGRITATLVKALKAEREQNNRRVLWLNSGAAAIVTALVFVAGAALTLLL